MTYEDKYFDRTMFPLMHVTLIGVSLLGLASNNG